MEHHGTSMELFMVGKFGQPGLKEALAKYFQFDAQIFV